MVNSYAFFEPFVFLGIINWFASEAIKGDYKPARLKKPDASRQFYILCGKSAHWLIIYTKVTETTAPSINLLAALESLLFVASGPVTPSRLATALETTTAAVENLLQTLEREYAGRGLRLQWSGGAVQLTSAPESATAVERFLGLEMTTRLSQAALEALAIIAYMQPVTRPQIDQIRGVNSDSSLRVLLSQGLIEEMGRMETPGRPILYGVTPEFMQHFGLSRLEELPELDSGK
jgi:segregation and condensation protein B